MIQETKMSDDKSVRKVGTAKAFDKFAQTDKRQKAHDKFIDCDRANGRWEWISKLFPRAT